MGKRLLVASMSLGGGHGRAGQCVASAVAEMRPDWEVRIVDVRDYAAWWFRLVYVTGYLFTVRHIPWLWGLLYRHPGRHSGGTLPPWVIRLALRRFEQLVREYRPDVILSTQITASEATDCLRRRGLFAGAAATVVTDFDAHPTWRADGIDCFFVPDEDIRQRLARRGIPLDRIEATGVPIDPAFEQNLDNGQLRAKHGIRPGVPAVLLMGGSLGLGALRRAVRGLLALGEPMDLVVVAGHNERLRRRLAAMRADGLARLHVLGFVDYIAELMAVADLFVSKPGGLSMTEALTMGLPTLAVDPLPGQEEANASHLEAQGVVLRPARGESLPAAVKRLLGDPAAREHLAQAARAYAHRGTARRIASRVIELAEGRE